MDVISDLHLSLLKSVKYARIPRGWKEAKVLKWIGTLALLLSLIPLSLQNVTPKDYSLLVVALLAIGYPLYMYGFYLERKARAKIFSSVMEEPPDDERFLGIFDYDIFVDIQEMDRDDYEEVQYLLQSRKEE